MNCADCFWCKVKIPIIDGGYLSYETADAGCKKNKWVYDHSEEPQTVKYIVNKGNGCWVALGGEKRRNLRILKLAQHCEHFESMED